MRSGLGVAMAIRKDLTEAHDRAWDRLGRAGTWLNSAEKVSIAEETRSALACIACAHRKEALTPEADVGVHNSASDLHPEWVDVIHRITTDANRLTKRWFDRVVPEVLSTEKYVETIGIIAETIAIDRFHVALGLPLRNLPIPKPGEPSRESVPSARESGAWVPMVNPDDLSDADPAAAYAMYEGRGGANIHRALSLVPACVSGFFDLDDAMYLPDAMLRRFDIEPRAISHSQIELLAARVSALNRCLY
jgi:hypothetical protein